MVITLSQSTQVAPLAPGEKLRQRDGMRFFFARAIGIASIYFTVLAVHADSLTYTPSGNLAGIFPTQTSPPSILAHPRSLTSSTNLAAIFSVVAGGTPPLTYQWQFNSKSIPGASSDTLILTNLSLANFGFYRVMVANAQSSATSSNAWLQLDSDRDGMADAWEVQYFGSITNRIGFEDDDQDRASTREEFLEGTQPKFLSSLNPRLTIISDRAQVSVRTNLPYYTNGQTVTLTAAPNPGEQFISYLGQPELVGGPFYSMRTNPAALRFGAIGVGGSQVVRAICGLPIPGALNVTNEWRIDQAGWFGQRDITHDGVAAAQSARILGTEEAWLVLSNVYVKTEGTLTYWCKVDGSIYDQLRFARNEILRPGVTATNTDWIPKTVYLPVGNNTVRWVYHKVGNEVSEYVGTLFAPLDAAWVDEVSYGPWTDPSRDEDNDGLPDLWEYKNFDTLESGAADDPDRDGISNLDEYLDATDPNSNASFLPRLTILAQDGSVARNPELAKYKIDQVVALRAVPNPGAHFVIWDGAALGTNITNSVLMHGNKTVAAVFGLPLEGALDAPTLTWTRTRNIGFFGQSSLSRDGRSSARSGPVGGRQESGMETSVTGPGTVVFWWKAMGPTNLNFGRFFIDQAEQPEKISGQTEWRPQSFFVGPGVHALRWNYTNATSLLVVSNGVWVDQVAFTPGSIGPTIEVEPQDVSVNEGDQAQFRVYATGTPPLTYQWYRNGSSLVDSETNSILTIKSVSASDVGSFTVRVSNAAQSVTSRVATLAFRSIANPILTSARVVGGMIEFDLNASPGTSYQIEASDDLISWNSITSGVVPASGNLHYSDAIAKSPHARFYRVRIH